MPSCLPRTPALVVLAAGMGSRYGGLKQIDPVGPSGEAVLDYSVFDARRAGFGKVVFVIRRDIESAFRDQIGRRFENRIDVHYVFQELDRLPIQRRAVESRQKPWGTGHAVWCAAPEMEEPFAVINADDFYCADSFCQLGRFLASASLAAQPAEACMVGFRLANTLSEFGTVSRGICTVDQANLLRSVQECTALERAGHGACQTAVDGSVRTFGGSETVSMNCWGFTPAFLPLLERRLIAFLDRAPGPKEEFYLPAAVTDLIDARAMRVHVARTQSVWFGVTYREDRPRIAAALRELVSEGVYPARLAGEPATTPQSFLYEPNFPTECSGLRRVG